VSSFAGSRRTPHSGMSTSSRQPTVMMSDTRRLRPDLPTS
jgi:hypothetical protein